MYYLQTPRIDVRSLTPLVVVLLFAVLFYAFACRMQSRMRQRKQLGEVLKLSSILVLNQAYLAGRLGQLEGKGASAAPVESTVPNPHANVQ
jgi:hypothetical protein